ncbi:MAG TPA: Gfo/Idh/MocA family oxidoreductase [Pyrinomonadaceae bacterium]|jgi:predicted dehydrogenase
MAVRLGIVGCGRVTEARHLPALRGIPEAEVSALSDVDVATLESVGERFAVARRYSDYREMIESGGVDAVAVCVPPKFHTEIALAALGAGKHLFVEKPLALSLDECRLLRERAAVDGKLKVLVGFNMRWHRLVREAREIIRRGELGEIKLVRTVFTSGIRRNPAYPEWRRRRESGGGAQFELGVHHFDLLRFLLASEAREVSASSASGDETVTVSIRMSDGEQVVCAFSEGTGENHEIEVYGERRWLRLSCYRADGLELYEAGEYPGAVGVRLRRAAKFFRDMPRMVRQSGKGGDYVASYAEEWRHFIDSIRNDGAVESTLHDGQRALEIALAALESTTTKRVIEINAT